MTATSVEPLTAIGLEVKSGAMWVSMRNDRVPSNHLIARATVIASTLIPMTIE